jgi:hypothetical protein
MSSTVQISLDSIRENQLADIQSKFPDVPRGQTDAVKYILFERMDKMLGVKKA